MITHVMVRKVVVSKESFLERVKNFLLTRKRKFSMPSLRFVSNEKTYTPLINLEYGRFQPIELPCPIDEKIFHPEILNPNDYPVLVDLSFIGVKRNEVEVWTNTC